MATKILSSKPATSLKCTSIFFYTFVSWEFIIFCISVNQNSIFAISLSKKKAEKEVLNILVDKICI